MQTRISLFSAILGIRGDKSELVDESSQTVVVPGSASAPALATASQPQSQSPQGPVQVQDLRSAPSQYAAVVTPTGSHRDDVFFAAVASVISDHMASNHEITSAIDVLHRVTQLEASRLRQFIIHHGVHPTRAPGALQDDAAADLAMAIDEPSPRIRGKTL